MGVELIARDESSQRALQEGGALASRTTVKWGSPGLIRFFSAFTRIYGSRTKRTHSFTETHTQTGAHRKHGRACSQWMQHHALNTSTHKYLVPFGKCKIRHGRHVTLR